MSSISLTIAAASIAFGSVLAGSLGVPIPTFAAIIYLGSLLAERHGTIAVGAATFAAAMAGAVLGDVAWFFAGRRYGGKVLGLICKLSLSRDTCVHNTTTAFARRGIKVLLFARFVPGLSVISAPLAGIAGISLGRFVEFAETGAALWVAVGLGIGFFFAAQVDAILRAFEHFGLSVGGLALLLVATYAAISWVRRRRLLRQLRVARILPADLAALLAGGADPIILDARSAFDRAADPFIIPGSLLLDGSAAELTLPHHVEPQPVVIYCACPNEISAAVLARRLHKLGFPDVRPLGGGLVAWRTAGHPVVPITPPDPPAPPSVDAGLTPAAPAEMLQS